MKHVIDQLLSPRSVAVIGASDQEHSVGYAIYRNLRQSAYQGQVWPVNLKHNTIQGDQAYSHVHELPANADLAIIATPEKTVLDLVKQCGKAGIQAVIIITAGFLEDPKALPKLKTQIQKLTVRYQMRVLGPQSFGVINTRHDLNATFAHRMALPGHIALISQSGALCASLLDWSISHQFGFSFFISLGSMVDISFAELIDFLGADDKVSGIIIYMESLQQVRPFISASRAFARTKPILVLKAGSSLAGAAAVLKHTGSPSGYDLAFDAIFRRVGILRVHALASLFFCAKGLAMQKKPSGKRLTIISNAGGPAILATDYLLRHGGTLGELSKDQIKNLDAWLSPHWSRRNPIDLSGDAAVSQFGQSLETLIGSPGCDGILVIFTPQGVTDAMALAQVLAKISKTATKPLLTSFMGRAEVREAVTFMENQRIPNYAFPENAVEVFLRMAEHQQHIKLLYETVPSTPEAFENTWPQQLPAWLSLKKGGHLLLSGPPASDLLQAFQLPLVPTHQIHSIADLERLARSCPFPWSIKYTLTPSDKPSEVFAVRVETIRDVFLQYRSILKNHADQLVNLWVEQENPRHLSLQLTLHSDDLCGPLITVSTFGMQTPGFDPLGANKAIAVGIPPLNMALAKDVIAQLHAAGYYSQQGEVKDQNLYYLLVKVSYLAIYLPQLKRLHARIEFTNDTHNLTDITIELLGVETSDRYGHLAIAPYPIEWMSTFVTKTGQTIQLRPIRPEDEPLEKEFFTFLSKESLYFRFFGYISGFTQEMLSRFTHIDYDREMALIALTAEPVPRMAGVVRIIGDGWRHSAEYAIIVADRWQGQGIGFHLTETIIRYARSRSYRVIHCSVLKQNESMLRILDRFGFKMKPEDVNTFTAELEL